MITRTSRRSRVRRVLPIDALRSVLLLALGGWTSSFASGNDAWKRHTIDDNSRGADGVRLTDANGDGLLDIATGWEEGGIVRVYLNPGPEKSAQAWPAVTVGRVKSPEDALLIDLDSDGATDVVSCCEGRTRTIFVHWAPSRPDQYLEEAAWKTAAFPATEGQQMWMFALSLQVDGRHGRDLVVGSKGGKASISWLEAPADPRNLADWKLHRICDAGWIMSLEAADLNSDGRPDVVASDRKGASRGILWLETPQVQERQAADWTVHRVGGEKHEVMFLSVADLNGDGLLDITCPTRNKELLLFHQQRDAGSWKREVVGNPFGVPHGKAAAVADLDLDGRPDIVHSSNTAGKRTYPGVACLSSHSEMDWSAHNISGSQGAKFDLLKLVDLDHDGDLDVLTCEERDNLGVFWYENPTR